MSEHPLDRIFRERLAHRKAGPTDHLWAGIAAKQRAKRIRRRLMYTAAVLAALCLLVAGYFMLAGTTTPAEVPSRMQPEPISTEQSRTAPLAQEMPDTDSNDLPIRNGESLPPAEVYLPSAHRQVQNEEAPVQLAILTAEQSRELPVTSEGFQPTPTTLSTPDPRDQLADLAAAADALNDKALEADSPTSPKVKESIAIASGYELSLLQAEELPPDRLNRSKADRLMIGEDYVLSATAESSIKPSRLKNRFELEATVGPAYANQILKTSSEIFRPDLDARQISEFPHLSYSGVVRLRYRLANGFSLLGGVGYTALRNRLEYEMPILNEEPALIERTNSLRLVELPLMLGYEFPGEKVKLGISAGPVVNIMTRANGEYLSAETQMPVGFDEGNVYETSAGLAWRFHLTTSYPIGRGGTRLLVEPTFSHYPRSFTQDSYPISERYWVAGLQVGIRKLLR